MRKWMFIIAGVLCFVAVAAGTWWWFSAGNDAQLANRETAIRFYEIVMARDFDGANAILEHGRIVEEQTGDITFIVGSDTQGRTMWWDERSNIRFDDRFVDISGKRRCAFFVIDAPSDPDQRFEYIFRSHDGVIVPYAINGPYYMVFDHIRVEGN